MPQCRSSLLNVRVQALKEMYAIIMRGVEGFSQQMKKEVLADYSRRIVNRLSKNVSFGMQTHVRRVRVMAAFLTVLFYRLQLALSPPKSALNPRS